MNGKASEVPKIALEFPEMSTADFAQRALQANLAPPVLGQVQTRLHYAISALTKKGWTANRVRDLWYYDGRASDPTWDEITDLEELTGLRYARRELHEVDTLIENATARLLMGNDPDFYRPFVAALRALLGAQDRTGISHGAGTGNGPHRRSTD